MGRVAVDFGVGQGAKRSADIRSDLGQASNEGQRQNQRNPGRHEAEAYKTSSANTPCPEIRRNEADQWAEHREANCDGRN
jgi:hypothetical protein